MESVQKKTLVAKLAEACNAVGGVEKKGRNDFHNYNYVKAADIAKLVRHEFFKRGIILTISEKEFVQTRIIKTNSGGEMPEWLLKCEVTFHDGSETLGPFGAFGVAADKADKALYKAKTGCLKYVLRSIGLIPDEKDDPEFDERVDEETDPRVLNPPESKAVRKKKAKILEYQARAWDAACRENGKTPEMQSKFLRIRYSASMVTELTQEDFKEAIKWAVGSEDLTKTLATSAEVARGKKQPVADIIDEMPDEFDQRIAGD
jgi:hypothetical protein